MNYTYLSDGLDTNNREVNNYNGSAYIRCQAKLIESAEKEVTKMYDVLSLNKWIH